VPRVDVILDLLPVPRRVGQLLAAGAGTYFEYDTDFLRSGLELSPLHLPLRPGVFNNGARHYDGLWGVFDDSLPDTWGLLLIRRDFERRGIDPDRVSPLALLRYLGTRTVGALTYHPPEHEEEPEPLALVLDEIAGQAERLYEGSAEDVLEGLREAGGSSGGARPKALVAVRADGHMVSGAGAVPTEYRHYLIKFPLSGDQADVGLVEAAYAEMARRVGIAMPPTRLFRLRDGRQCFGVERFDREAAHPKVRRHMHSLGGLLHANYREPAADYRHLLQATQHLTRDHSQVVEAFRRMVFNVLACNRDDHVKNFAFLMDETGVWSLSPAFDVTYEPRAGAYEHHTTSIRGVTHKPTAADAVGLAEEFSIERGTIREVVAQAQDAVASWPTIAGALGIPRRRQQRIAASLEEIRRDFGAVTPSPATRALLTRSPGKASRPTRRRRHK
jgi:serine/threonine-protein kinase HipA